MVDNRDSLNNGHSPFRRYVPPTNQGPGTGNQRVRPLAQASTPPQGQGHRTVPSSSSRHRSPRNRWRQWVGGEASQSSPQASVAPPQSPPTAPRRTFQLPPQPDASANRPQSPGTPPPSGFVKNPSRQPAGSSPYPTGVPPQRPPHPSVTPISRGIASRQRQDPNKVTPLRRKAGKATPGRPTVSVQRDRKPRRRSKPAPRPVLYGIRLLILGTGIAAITGTVLSLNPARTGQSTDSSANEPNSTALAPLSGRRQAAPATSVPLPLATELTHVETELVSLEAMTPGLSQAVFFYDLDTGNYIDLNGTSPVAAASTIKVPILVAFLAAVDEGTLRLDQAMTLREDVISGGSGDMQTHAIGTQYTALEVATEMIVNSDNTATNMMIELLGGRDRLNQMFQAWGLQATVLRNPLPDLEGTNTTSSADLVRVMVLVDQGELLSLRARDRMFNIMQRTYTRTLIPGGLEDETAVVLNKTGDIGTSLGDVALVDAANGKRYIMSILVARPHNDGRANELIRRVAGRIHQEMNQPISPVGGNPSTASQPEAAGDRTSTESPTPATEVPRG